MELEQKGNGGGKYFVVADPQQNEMLMRDIEQMTSRDDKIIRHNWNCLVREKIVFLSSRLLVSCSRTNAHIRINCLMQWSGGIVVSTLVCRSLVWFNSNCEQ